MNFLYELTGVEQTQSGLMGLDSRIRREVVVELEHDMAELSQLVVNGKLSGQVLNKRSGALSSAVSADVNDNGTQVVGRVYVSGVPYAKINEYGGQTPAHTIFPNQAEALYFLFGGVPTFAKKVNHPGSKIPERSYLRSALFDMHDQILQDLQDAAIRGAKS